MKLSAQTFIPHLTVVDVTGINCHHLWLTNNRIVMTASQLIQGTERVTQRGSKKVSSALSTWTNSSSSPKCIPSPMSQKLSTIVIHETIRAKAKSGAMSLTTVDYSVDWHRLTTSGKTETSKRQSLSGTKQLACCNTLATDNQFGSSRVNIHLPDLCMCFLSLMQ